MATTIAQASATVRQGGSSNLKRFDEFKTHIFLSPFFKYILGLKSSF